MRRRKSAMSCSTRASSSPLFDMMPKIEAENHTSPMIQIKYLPRCFANSRRRIRSSAQVWEGAR
jgi:hypothetical protein